MSGKRPVPRLSMSLIGEMLRAELYRLGKPFRELFRGNMLYRWIVCSGPVPEHLLFHPYDAAPRKLEEAEALLRGRFKFEGGTVDIRDGSIFEHTPPSPEWAEALRSFAWLPPLAFAGGDAAHLLAKNLIAQWLRRNPSYSEPDWLPHITARRLLNIFAHGRTAFEDDVALRKKLFGSIREQARILARTAREAPDGLPRFEAVSVAALSALCLPDKPKIIDQMLANFEAEITRQIFADGGHISRSPEALLDCYRYITLVMDALTAARKAVPQPLRSAHDRMAPMIRFFRHGDGALALFNGGGEGDARTISALLARDDVRGQPHAHAPHSGYQRIIAGHTFVAMDCGDTPPEQFSTEAHASTLAFEFSSGAQRIVVNCGAATHQKPLQDVLRVTAAHSTITLSDLSTAFLIQHGIARKLLGARLLGGPQKIDTNRMQTPQGWSITASHDAYVPQLGFAVERMLSLSPQGLVLTGRDRLVPVAKAKRGSLPFAIRFHIHPDIRVSPSQGGGILLKLANGEGWRFRASGQVSVEESIYLGSGPARKTEQLVVTGAVRDAEVQVDWLFEQIGAT
ncbi:MAG TPA: heparinase II/III family protein [Rhizomicrobium sp.]